MSPDTILGRRAAASAALALFLSVLTVLMSRSALAQTETGNPTRKAGKYAVELHLPAEGLHPGSDSAISLHVIDTSGNTGVAEAKITARLSMPAMAGMTMRTPTVAPGAASGDYIVTVLFPHAGDYRLDLTVTPPGDRAFSVSFPLTVTEMGGMPHEHGMGHMMESLAGIAETQEASGTSWQPAASPMYGLHTMVGRWMVMTHYNVFLNYDRQEGPRGDYQYDSTNWLMLMASRPVGRDRLQLRTMLTLEPLTVTPGGYPLLFQSGEQYHGHPLVDRQHPHDLFMELAARYTHPTGRDSAVFLYAAPSGEPALGPTAFMHRLSALDMPMAPITHHWMDSTHIDFGVLTLGAWKRQVQLEASYFTGREPDEFRYNLGPMHMDSVSGRLSFNPGPNWNLQTSYGYLHSPEALRPQEDIRRTTASVAYVLPRHDGGFWATTFAYGNNNSSGGVNSDAYLLESELNLANRHTLFTRFEFVNKLGEELALTPADRKFGISETTLGYVFDFTPNRSYQTGLGAAVTFNTHPASLDSVYGKSPMGFWVFLRIRPAPMHHDMGSMAGMGGMEHK